MGWGKIYVRGDVDPLAKSRIGYSAALCTGSRTPAPRRRHASSDLRAVVRIGLGFEVHDCVRVGAVRGGEHRCQHGEDWRRPCVIK